MRITDRQSQILEILNERVYITVNELASLTFTSPSSIRRDLTSMQNGNLVRRCHGGVTLPEKTDGVAGFSDRMHKNTKEKRIIAQTAASFLADGQSILLDGSSTVTFLLPFIAKCRNVTVFTNNMNTALDCIKLGIDTYCLGGHAKSGSVALSGAGTYRAVSEINTDILFFSSQSIDKNGSITDSTEEENFARICMLKSAKKSVFLCDSSKFGTVSLYKLCNIGEIDAAVFDKRFDGLKNPCKELLF